MRNTCHSHLILVDLITVMFCILLTLGMHLCELTYTRGSGESYLGVRWQPSWHVPQLRAAKTLLICWQACSR